MSQQNAETIRRFVAAWSRLDPDELVDFFTEDGVYHNIPTEPVKGHGALRPFIAGFIEPWTRTEWELVSLVADGDRVIAERIDHIEAGDVRVDLPCCGVFELRDGRIAEWRDYFDLGTYMRAFQGRGGDRSGS
jgi:limonene-1,2-epoxide hydrolase